MALAAVRARRWGSPGSRLRAWMDACGQSMVPGWVSVGRAQSGLCHGLCQGLCGLAGAQSLGTACWGHPPALAQRGCPLGPASPWPPAACEPGLCPQATHSAGLRGSPAASPTWPRVAWTPSPQPGGRCLQGLRGAGFQRGKQADPGQLPVGRLLRKPSVQAY